MKNKISSIITLSLIFSLLIGSVSFAGNVYEYKDYETTDDGFVIVKELDENAPSKVVLYMYTEADDRNIKNINNHYSFYYRGDSVDNPAKPLQYQFSPYNAKVYESLSAGDVWVWQFALYNGCYEFSDICGSDSYGSLPTIYTLTSEFEFPTPPDGYGVTVFSAPTEKMFIEDETIRLYAIYGNKAWRQENLDEFINWSIESEKSFRAIEDGMNQSLVESEEKITVDIEIPEIAMEEIKETEEAEVNISNTEKNKAEEVTQTEIPESEPTSDNEKESEYGVLDLLNDILKVVILVVALYVISRKCKQYKKKEN